MKQIIIASSVLLCAGAIYGFIDYRQQTNTGKLDKLYKDDVYNSGARASSGLSFASKKEIDIENYSRAPLGTERFAVTNENELFDKQEMMPTETSVKKKAIVKTKKAPEPAIEENYALAFIKAEEPAPKMEEPKIIYLASVADSVEFRKGEAKELKMAMFSRAPIRKKTKKVEVVVLAGAESSTVQ